MTTNEIRRTFWSAFPKFRASYQKEKTQNDYQCDIRCAFIDYVDFLCKNGTITEEQANNITL